jgi:DNA helicase-2/ATP-dependent DNA helicase PcrA
VLTETGYQAHLQESGRDEDQERLANIQELLTAARQFDELTPGEGRLEEFLEDVCLVNDVDVWEPNADRVAMMTLHASKGLEFPCVFIVAVEEGLLPHERSKNDEHELEEERRLLFVAMTRAQQELQLSVAKYREFRGRRKMAVPSKFLLELPKDELECSGNLWSGPVEVPEGEEWDVQFPLGDESDLHAHQEETVWQPEGTEAGQGQAATRTRLPSLITAAQLAGSGETAASSPGVFHQGMVVLHPEYGLGKIVALSGSGVRRTATVSFASAGQRKFVLSQSALQPVKRGEE